MAELDISNADISNNLTISDVTERHIESNHWNYTEEQKSVRKIALISIRKDYPDLPPLWAENIYDLITNKSSEEVQQIIDSKSWEQTPKKRN
tara:strand:+ start:1992 stop:2267 length:276 start_codon:yes stop_codon:yes gene_type:complete